MPWNEWWNVLFAAGCLTAAIASWWVPPKFFDRHELILSAYFIGWIIAALWFLLLGEPVGRAYIP